MFLGLRYLGRLLAAESGKSRQVGWQPAILESRILVAELGKSRQVYASLGK